MTSVLTQTVARLLLAPILLIAVAVLVKGYADVGDGFSAGVIAALGILLQYQAFGHRAVERMLPIRIVPPLAFVGLLLGFVVALVPVVRGEPIFTHLPPPGSDVIHVGTIELITAVAFDISIFALVLGSVVGIIHAIARAGEEAGIE